MKKHHIILLTVNLVLIVGFGTLFFIRLNYEFLIYVGVIIFFLGLIGASIRKVDYTLSALTGLTVWAALHLAGGGIVIGDGRLYDVILIRLSDTYPVFRYDQLVHVWGFGVCVPTAFSLISGALKKPVENRVGLSAVLVMAALGMGALNEIVEFAVSICVPESGVGGYMNTSLDLCADLIGALFGLLYVRIACFGRRGECKAEPARTDDLT